MAAKTEVESHKNVNNVKKLKNLTKFQIYFWCDSKGPRASNTFQNDQNYDQRLQKITRIENLRFHKIWPKNVKNVKNMKILIFLKIHFQCDSEGPRASKTPKNDPSDS